MATFSGQHEHTLDAKDRLTIPARFRAPLSDGVVLMKWLDPCVAVFTPEGFGAFSERFLATLNPFSERARRMKRFFHANSFDEELDSAGRVRLPRALVEYASLQGPCTVIGVSDHLELWNPERLAAHADDTESIAELAEGLAVPGGA